MRRPPKIKPYQTKISTQNIKDYSTPEGASKANLEFRRLAFEIEKIKEKEEPEKAYTQTPEPKVDYTPKKLIIYHNGNKVMGDDTEVLNFIDSYYKFDINRYTTPRQRVDIKLKPPLPEKVKIYEGVVALNRLPLEDTEEPVPIEEEYKYANENIKPPKYSGWYVYGIIPSYNIGFKNNTAYRLTLNQIKEISLAIRDTYGNEYELQSYRFPNEEYIPQHEMLPNGNIIVHGICKPDINYLYKGTNYNQELIYIDEQNKIIVSNLIYYYILETI